MSRAVDENENSSPPPCRTCPWAAAIHGVQARPDGKAIAAGVKYFATVRMIGACLQDPGIAARHMADIAVNSILDASPGIDSMDQWMVGLQDAMSGVTHEIDTSALTALWTRPGTRLKLSGNTRPVPDPEAPWTPPSAREKLPGTCVRYCDLPDLAVRAVLESLQDGPAIGRVRVIEISRNRCSSGAVKPEDLDGLVLSAALGNPDPSGKARDAAEDAGQALDPAPEAAVLQALLSACTAVRRAEQLSDPDMAAKPPAVLSIDATLHAVRYAAGFAKRHPELLDAYGFDYESAVAAWQNLAVYAGSLPDMPQAAGSDDVARLFERFLDRMK